MKTKEESQKKNVPINDLKEVGLQFLFCHVCNQPAHLYCLGVNTAYEQVNGLNMFICNPCQNKDTPVCIICEKKQGIMTKINNKNYAHITCALYCEQTLIKNPQNMQFYLKSEIPQSKNHCKFCKGTKSLYKCGSESCNLWCHIKCALENNCEIDINSDQIWQIQFFFKNNQQQFQFDQGVQENWKKEIESMNGQVQQFLKQKKINQKFDLNSEEIIQNFKKDLNEQTSKKKIQSKIYCPCHSKLPNYCLCYPKNTEYSMICCDWCENWFHYSCVEIVDQNANQFLSYFCHSCQKWTETRLQLQNGQYDQFFKNIQDLYSQHYYNDKMKTQDIIVILQGLQKSLNIQNFQQALNICKSLPVNSVLILEWFQLQEGFTVKLEEFLLSYNQESCLEGYGYLLENYYINKEKFNQNKQNGQILVDLYEKLSYVEMPILEKKKIDWLNNFYSLQFSFMIESSKHQQTRTVEKIQQLYEEGMELKMQNFNEIRFLKEIIGYLKKVHNYLNKKFENWDGVISKDEFMEMKEKVNQLEINDCDLSKEMNIRLEKEKQLHFQENNIDLFMQQALSIGFISPLFEKAIKLQQNYQNWNQEVKKLQSLSNLSTQSPHFSILQQLIEIGNNQLQDFQIKSQLEFLQQQLQKSQEIQNKIDKILKGKFDYHQFIKIKKEIELHYYQLNQTEQINQKLDCFKHFNQLLSKKTSIKELKESITKCKQMEIEGKIFKELEAKLEIGLQIQSQIDQLTNKNDFEDEDAKNADDLINKIEQSKIQFDISDLKIIIDQKQFLQNLFNLISKENFKFSQAKIILQQNLSFVESCHMQVQQIIEQFPNVLDSQIASIHNQCQFIIWQIEAQNVLNYPNPEKFEILYQKSLQLNIQNQLQEQIQIKYNLIKNLKDRIQQINFDYIKQGFNDPNIYMQIQSEINNLEFQLQIQNMNKELEEVKKIQQISQLKLKIDQFLQGFKDYNEGQNLLQLAKQIQYDNDQVKNLEQILDQSNDQKEKLQLYFYKKSEIQQQMQNHNKNRKKMLEINKNKFTYQEIQQEYSKDGYKMFENQIYEINEDLNQSEMFFKRVEQFLNQCRDFRNDEINIKTQNLVSEMIEQIFLRNEDIENKLLVFEAEFHAQLLIKNKDTIDKWIGLYKYSEQLNIRNLEWFNCLKSQINLYNEHKQFTDRLKENEKNPQISYQKFLDFTQRIDKQLIITIDTTFIDQLKQKSIKALQFFNEIMNSDPKEIISQFKKAEQNFKLLPFQFQEEKEIKQQFQNYLDLQNLINKSKDISQRKNSQAADQRLSQEIIEFYNNCKIYNADAQKIKLIFENAKQILQEVISQMNNNLNFEQIFRLSIKLDQIQINLGQQHEEVVLNIWMQKVTLLKQKQKLHFKQLNSFLKEGYQLLQQSQNVLRIKNFIIYLEDQILQFEKLFDQLNEIRLPNKIDEFQQNLTLTKFDISEEIIEYKTNLTYNKHFQIQIDSQVKQPYSKFQGNLTDTQGLVRFLQEEKEPVYKQSFQIKQRSPKSKINPIKKILSTPREPSPVIKKMRKISDNINININNVIPQPSQNVSEQLRRNIKIEIFEIMKNNIEFGQNIKSHVKIIENDVFGKFYNNSYKYTTELNIYIQFFRHLLRLPNLSQIIVKRNFSLDSLKKVYNKEFNYLQQLDMKQQQKKNQEIQNELNKQKIKKIIQSKDQKIPKKVQQQKKQQSYDPLNMPFIENKSHIQEINSLFNDDEDSYKPKPKKDRLQSLIQDNKAKQKYNIFEKPFESQQLQNKEQNDKAEFSEDEPEEKEAEIEYKQNDIQDLLYDPEAGISLGQIKKKEKEIPQGSLLKLFDGKIQFTDVLNINLLTCEDIQKVNKFPKITNSYLKVQGKQDLIQFLDFIIKYKQTLISGWVQATNIKDFDNIELLANKFLNTNKVGGLKYGKYSSLHLLHFKQIEKIRDLIKIKFQLPFNLNQNLQQKQSSMIFVITTKSGPFIGEDLNQPQLIQTFDKEYPLIEPFKNMDGEEDQISVITNEDNDKNKQEALYDVMEFFQDTNNQIIPEEPVIQGENEILYLLKNMNEQELSNFIQNFNDNEKQKILSMVYEQQNEFTDPNQIQQSQQYPPPQINQLSQFGNPLLQPNQPNQQFQQFQPNQQIQPQQYNPYIHQQKF